MRALIRRLTIVVAVAVSLVTTLQVSQAAAAVETSVCTGWTQTNIPNIIQNTCLNRRDNLYFASTTVWDPTQVTRMVADFEVTFFARPVFTGFMQLTRVNCVGLYPYSRPMMTCETIGFTYPPGLIAEFRANTVLRYDGNLAFSQSITRSL